MRVLIAGAGAMGKAWGRNLRDHPDVWVAGWVDIAPGRAEAAAEETSLRDCWTGQDLSKALVEVRPDFLVDVTVPEAHHDVTVQALAAGVPVLGEKPMADSMERARAMVDASEKSGRLYMVSQSRRYDARLAAFRSVIRDSIGSLGMLNTDFFIGAHFGGFRDEMPSPLLLDMAIHTFDAARYLCDADPVSVYCEEFNPPWSWYKGDACANCLFEMTGGLRFAYRGSWCSEGLHTSWEGAWRAVGEHGTAIWDGHGAPFAAKVKEEAGFQSDFNEFAAHVPPEEHTGIAGSLRDFLGALQSGKTPMGECHDNIKSLAMVFAALESALVGKRVRVET